MSDRTRALIALIFVVLVAPVWILGTGFLAWVCDCWDLYKAWRERRE